MKANPRCNRYDKHLAGIYDHNISPFLRSGNLVSATLKSQVQQFLSNRDSRCMEGTSHPRNEQESECVDGEELSKRGLERN